MLMALTSASCCPSTFSCKMFVSHTYFFDPKWHKLWKHHITLSVAADVVKRRNEFQKLSHRLKSVKTRITQAVQDGIANEPQAEVAYSKLKGDAVNLYPAGVVHPDAFWLAASPEQKV